MEESGEEEEVSRKGSGEGEIIRVRESERNE